MQRLPLLFILLHLVVSCAPLSTVQDKRELLAYFPQEKGQDLLSRYQPIFIVEKFDKPYNRIGTPKAKFTDANKEEIYVDTQEATIYAQTRYFHTSKSSYTNLIYQIHFSKTPYGLFPFQLGAGKNVGLIVIVTLNNAGSPVLYTTVHTCGCYLAFIPTTLLPKDAFPKDWPSGKQVVYSEILPSLLEIKTDQKHSSSLMVLLRDASHRVKDLWLEQNSSITGYSISTASLQPLSSLEKLRVNGSANTTSFYETSGKRIGFVKNSHKPLERVLMSWWTLEWRIGEDKRLGHDKSEPPIFFTSLKPWAREASDLRDFPTFLQYWKWNL